MILTAVALLLAQNVYALDAGEQSASREMPRALQVSCPGDDFSVFIHAFSNDTSIQKAFTRYPLKTQRLDPNAEPEPKEVTQNLGRYQIQFPILPLHEERVRRSLEIRIGSVTADDAQIALVKPDTGFQVSYFFKKNGCWKLTRIEDWSF